MDADSLFTYFAPSVKSPCQKDVSFLMYSISVGAISVIRCFRLKSLGVAQNNQNSKNVMLQSKSHIGLIMVS